MGADTAVFTSHIRYVFGTVSFVKPRCPPQRIHNRGNHLESSARTC